MPGLKSKYLSEISEVDIARWFGISESETQAFEEKYRAMKEKFQATPPESRIESKARVTDPAHWIDEDTEVRDRREWERWELWRKIY